MDSCDVLVIGGGAAGLSGAIALSRMRWSVLVVDDGRPRNAPAAGVHNVLGHDGRSPQELLRTGRAELARYGGTVVEDTAVSVSGERGEFVVSLAGGTQVRAARVLVTTGLVDELPDVPGLRERWGRDVLHCPFCHGWEVRDRTIGILATGPAALHQAVLFRQLSDDVTVLLNGTVVTPEQRDDLVRRGVRTVEGTVTEVLTTDDALSGVRLADGTTVGCTELVVAPRFVARSEVLTTDDALSGVRLADGTTVGCTELVVAPRFVARSEVLRSLGITATADPAGVGERVESDGLGRTIVPGVFVAGNVTDPMAQVASAMAAGLQVGSAIHADLLGLAR